MWRSNKTLEEFLPTKLHVLPQTENILCMLHYFLHSTVFAEELP
jgi:hypothetical protein